MEPISNADRLAALLRQKLRERSRPGASRKAGRKQASDVAAPTGAAAVRALAAVDGVDARQLRRAVIQHLLADQFGDEMINDAQFQQIVTRVADAIEGDQSGAALLDKVLGELRSA